MTRQGTFQGVVVARSREGNDELLAMLAKSGVQASPVETIRFEEPEDRSAVDGAMAEIGGFDWIAFTSPRAVAVFGEMMASRAAAGLPNLAAVGPGTAAALRKIGLEADFVPDRFLTAELGRKLPREKGKKVLLFRADIGDKALVRALEGRGFEVTDVAAYRTVPAGGSLDASALGSARFVVFASPSEVRGLCIRLGETEFGRLAGSATAVCIGPVTASAARSAGFKSVEFAARHTLDALAERVVELIGRA